jgi:hypothetical protein
MGNISLLSGELLITYIKSGGNSDKYGITGIT